MQRISIPNAAGNRFFVMLKNNVLFDFRDKFGDKDKDFFLNMLVWIVIQQQISLIQFLHFILLFENSSLLLQLLIEHLHSEHTIFSVTLLLYSNI
jgi:hypothetical protein